MGVKIQLIWEGPLLGKYVMQETKRKLCFNIILLFIIYFSVLYYYYFYK